jgi:hypothetical protein
MSRETRSAGSRRLFPYAKFAKEYAKQEAPVKKPPNCIIKAQAQRSAHNRTERGFHGAEKYPRNAGMYPRNAEMYPCGAGRYPHGAEMYPHGAEMYPRNAEMYPRSAEMYPRNAEMPPRGKDAPL